MATTSRVDRWVATSTMSRPVAKDPVVEIDLGELRPESWPPSGSFLWRKKMPVGIRSRPAMNKAGRSRKKMMPR